MRAAGDIDAVAAGANHAAGCCRAGFAQRDGGVDAHAFARQFGLGDWPRVEGANLARQHGGRLVPVEPGFGLVQLVRVRGAVLGLRGGLRVQAGTQ